MKTLLVAVAMLFAFTGAALASNCPNELKTIDAKICSYVVENDYSGDLTIMRKENGPY